MYAYLCMYICILFADVCVCVRIQFTVHPPSNFLFFLFCRLRVSDSEATGLAPLSADPRAALGECRPPGSSFCLAISSSVTIPPGDSLPQGRPREARRLLREWAFYGRRCLEGLTRCWLLPALRSGLAPRKRGSTAFLVNLSISSHTCALRHTHTLRLIDTHTFTRKQKHIHTD